MLISARSELTLDHEAARKNFLFRSLPYALERAVLSSIVARRKYRYGLTKNLSHHVAAKILERFPSKGVKFKRDIPGLSGRTARFVFKAR